MAHLLIAMAIVIGFIWALVAFPSFRVVAGILLVVGVGGYFVLSEKAAQEDKQQQAQKASEEQQRKLKFEADQKEYAKLSKNGGRLYRPPKSKCVTHPCVRRTQTASPIASTGSLPPLKTNRLPA